MHIMNRKNHTKGYALLFSVLISSLLITIGLSIFNLSLKEIMISTSERESQVAYYAAYSAFECLRYWNTIAPFPPYLNDNNEYDYQSTTTNIVCNNVKIPLTFVCDASSHICDASGNYYYATTTTNLLLPNAMMNIHRYVVSGNLNTFYTLYGHNTGIVGKRLERVIVRKL